MVAAYHKTDYRDYGAKGRYASTQPALRWWEKTGKRGSNTTDQTNREASEAVSACMALLREQQAARMTQYTIAARLYGNASLSGIPGYSLRLMPIASVYRDRIVDNVIQTCVDTATSVMAAKAPPRPRFLTNGGDYKQQNRAKKLEMLVNGIFYENDADEARILAFRDGAVWGDGFIHVFDHNGRVKWERVLPHEILVDDLEGVYGEASVRQMHRVQLMDRSVVCEMFPDYEKEILGATDAGSETPTAVPRLADFVRVRESWRLPTKEGGDDGAHLISVEGGGCLTPVENWPHTWFPFCRFRWSPRLYGYWSQGGAEQLQNHQIDLNRVNWTITQAHMLSGSFKVLVPMGSKVSPEKVNNLIGGLIEYVGDKPPQYVTPPVVPPETYQYRMQVIDSAFERFGLSRLSATATKPAGLDSGRAIREYRDATSDRFRTIDREYERFTLDLARMSIATLRDIVSDGSAKYSVSVPDKAGVVEVDWKAASMDEKDYVLQCFPASALPNDPAGRLQTVREMLEDGVIDLDTYRELIDFPDLTQAEAMANARRDWIRKCLDRIVEEGEYTAPDTLDNLALWRTLTLQYIAWAKSAALEQSRMALLYDVMRQLDDLDKKAMPPAPTMALPAGPQQMAPAHDMPVAPLPVQ